MTNSNNLAGYNRPQIVQTETSRLSCSKNLKTYFPVEQVLTHEVKGETYVPHLVEQCAMEVRVTALIKENGVIYIKSDEFRLRRPDLSFEVHQKIVPVSKNQSPKSTTV